MNTSAAAPVHRCQNGLPLRFRGPGFAVEFFKARGFQAVKVGVAELHSVCESSCVNAQRSSNHKVPRSHAWFAVVLRGSARAFTTACLSIQLAGVGRCVGGKPSKSASFRCSPSFEAATKSNRCAKGLSQLRTHLARGSLTTHSSGPSCVTRLLLPLRAAAQRER